MEKNFDKKWGWNFLTAVTLFVGLFMLFTYKPAYTSAEVKNPFWKFYYQDLVDEQYSSAGYEDRSPEWDKVFEKDTKENGQDLYLLAYQQVKKGPADAALENTATYFGYGQDDMLDIIDGEFYNMWRFDPSIAEYNVEHDLQTITGLTEKYNAVSGYYQQQLTLETITSELVAESKLQEIFANGDTSDSGFDLIVDLQVIEKILFGQSSEFSGGGSDSNGDYGGDGGSSSGTADSDPDEVSVSENSVPVEDQDIDVGIVDAKSVSDSDSDSDPDSEETAITPSECLTDSELENALDLAVLQNQTEDGNNTSGSSDGSDTGTDEPSDASDNSQTGNDDVNSGQPDSDIPVLPAADWSRGVPCTEFFCLEINFVTEDDEPKYEETDNCIDCHFTYILEIMRDLSEHGYVPNKVSGNMMEDATCKEASVQILPSFTVFLLSSPILTPPNDDVVTSVAGIGDSFMKAFCGEYDSEDPANELSLSDINTMRLLSLQNAEDSNLVDTTDLVIEQTYQEIEDRAQELAEFKLSVRMSDMTTMYQALETEIDNMNATFNSISDLFILIQDYLSDISQKPYQQ